MDAHPRMLFPRGLMQPLRGYRFGLDALLLACFARVGAARRVADLGAGCGAAGLGLLLRRVGQSEPPPELTAVEMQPELAACARANAARLGLEARVLEADLRALRPGGLLPPRSFDLAIANPPYHPYGQGRSAPDAGRRAARCESSAGLGDFLDAAAWLLRGRGRLALVFAAGRLGELLVALAAAGLAPKRLRLVHGRAGLPAKLVLAEAVCGGRPGLTVEPPLVLQHDASRRFTPQALAFCPFLGCNRGHATPLD